MFIVSWSCVWTFIQKIPPWEIWHVTLQFQIKFFQFNAYFLAKISMKFHSKSTSLRNMTHNTSIPNLNSTILCLFLAEISMKFHSKDTSLRNITHTTSFPNQNFTILCLLWAEVVYEFSFKRYLLGKYDMLLFNSKSNYFNFVLNFGWN